MRKTFQTSADQAEKAMSRARDLQRRKNKGEELSGSDAVFLRQMRRRHGDLTTPEDHLRRALGLADDSDEEK